MAGLPWVRVRKKDPVLKSLTICGIEPKPIKRPVLYQTLDTEAQQLRRPGIAYQGTSGTTHYQPMRWYRHSYLSASMGSRAAAFLAG